MLMKMARFCKIFHNDLKLQYNVIILQGNTVPEAIEEPAALYNGTFGKLQGILPGKQYDPLIRSPIPVRLVKRKAIAPVEAKKRRSAPG